MILRLGGRMVVKVSVASRGMFFISMSMGSKGSCFIIGTAFLDLFLSVGFSLPFSPLSVFVSLLSFLFCGFFLFFSATAILAHLLVPFPSSLALFLSYLISLPLAQSIFLCPGIIPRLFLSSSNLILLLCSQNTSEDNRGTHWYSFPSPLTFTLPPPFLI